MSKAYPAIITEEEGGFVALNPETGVASQGDTLDKTLANLKEALELYIEELGTKQLPSDMPHTAFLTTITI